MSGAIRDFAVTEQTTNTTSLVVNMPAHASGDMLVVFASKDGSVAINDPGGIFTSRINQATTGSYGRMLTGIATSSSETLTLTTATTDTWYVAVFAIRNPHATTPFELAAITGTNDTTNPYAGLSGQSTTNDNVVVFHFFISDSGQGPVAQQGATNLVNADSGFNSLGVAYTYLKTAGSIPAIDWISGVNDDSRNGVLGIRLADETYVPAYADPSTTAGTYLRPLHGVTSGALLTFGDAWDTSSPLSETTLGGVTVAFDAIGNVTDSGINPFLPSARISPVSSTSNIGGNEFTFGSALDLSSGILGISFRGFASRDLAIDQGDASTNGTTLVARSSAGNYTGWTISKKGDQSTNVGGRTVAMIGLNDGATAWTTTGNLNESSVSSMFLMCEARSGTVVVDFSSLVLVEKIGLAGGSTAEPMNFDALDEVVNGAVGVFEYFRRSGSAATIYSPLQFGGGSPINVGIDLRTFQFPAVYDDGNFHDWNCAVDVAGVEFFGVDSNDTFSFTNCLFISESSYHWRFNASHSASSTLDFSGTSVVGANVTLRSTSDLDGVTFINCGTFTQNSATLSDCVFNNTKVTSAAPADATLISDSTFISPGTGHGIEVGGTAADITLTGDTFTGYAVSDGSTGNEAVYINIATGSLTVTIQGGGTVPSIRTAGATVTVVNARTVRVTCKAAADLSNIPIARVALWATTGASVTITRIGSTATVAHTAHGYANGDKVAIFGADQGEYRGLKVISNVSADAYDYTILVGTPTTPATGTITSHQIILDGVTNGAGVIEDTAFDYTADLAVTGRARKSSAAPLFKTSPLSGTITDATGFETTVFMVSDE